MFVLTQLPSKLQVPLRNTSVVSGKFYDAQLPSFATTIQTLTIVNDVVKFDSLRL